MPWNGSGVFSRVYSWVSDAAAGLDILSDRMDTDTDDLAAGLMHCLTVNGETLPVNNLPMANFRHTGASPGVALSDYATVGQVVNGGGGISVGGFVPLAGNVTMTGPLGVNGELTVGGPGDLYLGRTDVAWAYVLRPNQAGYNNLGLAAAGGVQLAAILMNAANVSATGALTAAGGLTVDGAANIAGGLTTTGLQLNGTASVTANLYVTGNATVGGEVAAGGLQTTGVNSAYGFAARDNPGLNWTLYAQGNTARLYDGADRLVLDTGGNLEITGSFTVPNGIWIYGRANNGVQLAMIAIDSANNLDIGNTAASINLGAPVNAGSLNASSLTIGNITASGNAAAGSLGVTGGSQLAATHITSTLQVDGTLTVSSALTVGGGATITGTIVTNAVDVTTGSISAPGNITGGNLVATAAIWQGSATPTADAISCDNLVAAGNATLGAVTANSLTLPPGSSLSMGTLSAASLTVTGNSSLGGTLQVGGGLTVDGVLSTNPNELIVSNDLVFKGASVLVDVSGTLPGGGTGRVLYIP